MYITFENVKKMEKYGLQIILVYRLCIKTLTSKVLKLLRSGFICYAIVTLTGTIIYRRKTLNWNIKKSFKKVRWIVYMSRKLWKRNETRHDLNISLSQFSVVFKRWYCILNLSHGLINIKITFFKISFPVWYPN